MDDREVSNYIAEYGHHPETCKCVECCQEFLARKRQQNEFRNVPRFKVSPSRRIYSSKLSENKKAINIEVSDIHRKEKRSKMKKGSMMKFLITLVLTVIAVVLIGFVVKYFQGG